MRIPLGQRVAISAVTVWFVVMLGGLLLSPGFRDWAGMGASVLGLGLSIAGLLLAISRPQTGFVVGMVGIGILILSMPWLLPFYVPLPIVLGYGLVREQHATRPPAQDA